MEANQQSLQYLFGALPQPAEIVSLEGKWEVSQLGWELVHME